MTAWDESAATEIWAVIGAALNLTPSQMSIPANVLCQVQEAVAGVTIVAGDVSVKTLVLKRGPESDVLHVIVGHTPIPIGDTVRAYMKCNTYHLQIMFDVKSLTHGRFTLDGETMELPNTIGIASNFGVPCSRTKLKSCISLQKYLNKGEFISDGLDISDVCENGTFLVCIHIRKRPS